MAMRCAIYARYSSDLQYAERRGWFVEENCIRFDEAVSAAALHGRKALQSLVTMAKSKPRPFDRILIDDTSRLARWVEDGLRTIETLRYRGDFVTAVSQDNRFGIQDCPAASGPERHDGRAISGGAG